MNRSLSFFFLCVLSLVHTSVLAETPDVTIVNTVTQAMAVAANKSILPQAIIWLSSLMGLQFIITNLGLLKSGTDIEAIFGKLIGSLMWFSFCVYLLNYGPDFIDSVGHGMLTRFAPNIPTPGSIITSTLALCSTIMFAIVVTGTSVVGTGNSAVANVLVAVMFIVFSVGLYMAIKIMMISLELGLIIMLSPLSFSFLGLNALKDQGIAPLKSLISLVYRIVLLGVICTGFSEVMNVAGTALNSIDWASPSQWGSALNTVFSMLCSYPVIAYLVYKSDSIASSLASGSTGQGPGDVASAAAAGAAAGAAITSAGASVAGAASKAPQGMGDVMKAMLGSGGGSVSNASSRGMGGQASGEAPRRSASMSMPNTNSGTAGAPQRPSGSPGNAAQESGRSASLANVDTAPSRASMNNVASTRTPENTNSGSAEQGSAAAAGSVAPGESVSLGTPAPPQGDRASSNVDTAPVRPATPAVTGTPPGQPQKAPSGSKNLDPAPVRPAQTDNSRPPVRPVDSGATAGIGGASSPMEQKVDKVLAAMDQQQQPRKATFREKLGDANHHIAQEKAVTQISINTHHSD